MGKLSVFNFMSLNGCYKTTDDGINWHRHEAEEHQFSADSLQADNILLFGRVTYEMMLNFWTTPEAMQSLPVVATAMNSAEKIVFSRTMDKAEWNNSRVINGDIVEEMKKLKSSARDMTILGSGSILTQFAQAGLIDLYQFMIDPVAITHGVEIFKGIKNNLKLKLLSSKAFKSGTVLLEYEPIK